VAKVAFNYLDLDRRWWTDYMIICMPCGDEFLQMVFHGHALYLSEC
jgi:hypothetical protein